MKTVFMFLKNPREKIKFINKSGIPTLSSCLEPPPETTSISLNVFIENIDNQYIHNCLLWYK